MLDVPTEYPDPADALLGELEAAGVDLSVTAADWQHRNAWSRQGPDAADAPFAAAEPVGAAEPIETTPDELSPEETSSSVPRELRDRHSSFLDRAMGMANVVRTCKRFWLTLRTLFSDHSEERSEGLYLMARRALVNALLPLTLIHLALIMIVVIFSVLKQMGRI